MPRTSWIVWSHELDGTRWETYPTETAAMHAALTSLRSDWHAGDPIVEKPNGAVILASELAAYAQAHPVDSPRNEWRVEVRHPHGHDRWIADPWTTEVDARTDFDRASEHFHPTRVRLVKREP